MRCEEILHELAVPTGAVDPADLLEHQARCPACADFGERVRLFDRDWEATRPAEPSEVAWRYLWSAVEHRSRPATIPIAASARWKHRLMVVMALAQAAVLLIAALAVLRGPAKTGDSGSTEAVASAPADVAEEGQTLFICLDEQGRRVDSELRFQTPEQILNSDDIDAGAASFSVAWDMEFINSMEGAD